MKEIRETIHNHSELQGALRDSVAAPTIALSQRILAWTLKDEKFAVHTTASDQVIDDYFNHIFTFIEPQVDRDHLRKENLKDLPTVKQFMDKHCNISQYVRISSKMMSPASTALATQSAFDSLSFLPLPCLDSTKAHIDLSVSSMAKCQVILIDLLESQKINMLRLIRRIVNCFVTHV